MLGESEASNLSQPEAIEKEQKVIGDLHHHHRNQQNYSSKLIQPANGSSIGNQSQQVSLAWNHLMA